MDPTTEAVLPSAASSLRMIQLAMAAGIMALAAVVGVVYKNSHVEAAAAGLATIKLFSEIDAFFAVLMFAGSEAVYRSAIGPQPRLSAVQTATITRAAMREGASLMGLVVCFLAAQNGALRAQPLYWANALPAAIFVGWALNTLPTEDRLRAALGG